MVVGSCDLMVQDFGIMMSPRESRLEASLSFKEWQMEKNKLQFTLSFNTRNLAAGHSNPDSPYCAEADSTSMSKFASCQPELFSPRSDMEPDAAAVKLQKVYKSYRTRRNLADCAVVVEELWWRALDYASLNTNSVSFFDGGKSESTVSRWARARKKAAKVGKGLSKDEKAQKLALRHWLEAIDPRHRYGHNLSMYYDIWFRSESTQPFFYWLDIGDGKELNLERCPRNTLQQQCIEYLGPKQREMYEVIVRSGKLIYGRSQQLVNTIEGSKWIFVLSTCRKLYIGQKRKGRFQHSSFLAGAATTAAGRLVAKDGILKAIWPYSGHYLPTEENFQEFISFLMENNVDLTNVKKGAVDDDDYSSYTSDESSVVGTEEATDNIEEQTGNLRHIEMKGSSKMFSKSENYNEDILDNVGSPTYEFSKCMPFKWATGAGPRIGCVRDYPAGLQAKALEQVSLSPRLPATATSDKVPIPSPRPSHILMLSPRIACMGIPNPVQSPRYGHFVVPSPRVSLRLPVSKKRCSEEASMTNY